MFRDELRRSVFEEDKSWTLEVEVIVDRRKRARAERDESREEEHGKGMSVN